MRDGFRGRALRDHIDDCTPDACANGGTCVDGDDAFTCRCAKNWGGRTCTTKLFQGVGFLPSLNFFSSALAVSGDGSSVVGFTRAETGGTYAYRWRNGVMQQVGNGIGAALAVNHDGNLVAGSSRSSGDVSRATIWA